MQQSSSFQTYSSSFRDSPEKKTPIKDGKGYMYKKASYQYSTTDNNKSGSKDIDQLDALLEDLKNERQMSREKDLLSTSYTSKPIDRYEPYGRITKTSRVVTTSQQTGQEPQQLKNYIASDYNTLRSNGALRETLSREEKEHKNVYEETLPSPSQYESKSRIYESDRTVNNVKVVPPNSSVTVENIETDLKNIALTDDILPMPGTKVTTTVRTYTYEIPAGSNTNISTLNRNQNILYRKELNSINEPEPILSTPHIPATVVYNTESYSTIDKGYERPVVSNRTYEIHEHKESNTLRNNDVYPVRPDGPGRSEMMIRMKTTENTRTRVEPSTHHSPPVETSYTTTEYHNTQPRYPTGPTTNKYYYKESSNVVSTSQGSPNVPLEPNNYKMPNEPMYPPSRSPGYPPNLTNTTYKYTSTTTSNSRRGGPDYPLSNSNLPPAPFPVEGSDYPITNGNPPQKVDELMQSFSNVDSVDKTDIETVHRKREIETAVANPNQSEIPSVNRPGKEVYYPPGHDTMLQKREAMAAASAGGGRWAKGSGMYEYESGYKSKSKTKSGGAVVPVCLPLCCAMPCSIM